MSHTLVVVGMNHRTAPVSMREQLAVSSEGLEGVVKAVAALPRVSEAMLVATCNRVEVYAAGPDAAAVSDVVRAFLDQRAGGGLAPHLYEHRDDAAVRHAFRVCASLDSLVVGEPQILGQVKEAYNVAKGAGTTGTTLHRVMDRALQTAKRVRTETGIAAGQVSVASVAVDLARGIFGELQGRTVLLVGAGKMALGAARTLVNQGARLAVANRSYDRAVQLAQAHGGVAHPLTDLGMLLGHCDVVVCSTAATRYVLTREDVQAAMKARKGRALFLIDITVPRNVDPRAGDLDSVYLYNVDDLEQIVAEGLKGRGSAAQAAEALVAGEVAVFRKELKAQGVGPTVAALRERFKSTAQGELERSLSGKLKHLGPDERKALGVMLDAMVNKLLHAPTMALRSGADTPDGERTVALVRELFQLGALDEGAQEAPREHAGNGAQGTTSGELK